MDVIKSVAFNQTSLDEIGKKCGLSKFHLCRVFKSSTGITIQTYLNQLRIDRVCAIVIQGGENFMV